LFSRSVGKDAPVSATLLVVWREFTAADLGPSVRYRTKEWGSVKTLVSLRNWGFDPVSLL
jgi:hypothetical protein